MQEIGTWDTAGGSVAAVLEFESDTIDGNGAEMPKWLSGALQGAAAGAATGAAAGPYGALIGAAAGGTIGGAAAYAQQSSEPKPPASGASTTPAKPASTPSSAPSSAQANVIQALQQFASVIPALVQLVAASGKSGKESDITSDASELIADSDWGPESFEGAWTIP